MPLRWAALLAVCAGIIGIFAFPRFGVWPMAFVSVAAFSLAAHGQRIRAGAALGLIYGAAFFGPLLSWTGQYVGPAPWLLLAAAEACYFAGMGALLTVAQRLPAWPVWVGSAWVAQEAVRDRWPFGGFPWGRWAFSQASSPLRWFAALGGAPLVTFMVGLGGAGLALAATRITEPHWPAVARALAPGLALAVAVPVLGALVALPLAPPADDAGRTTTIALVQGGLPDLGLDFESRAREVLDNHVAETMQLVAEIKAGVVPQPQLVVWPENASDVDPLTDPSARAQISAVVQALDAPLLVGAILPGPGENQRRNVGILWSPTTGPGAMYAKRHPVPFAEYIPFRSVSEFVSGYAKQVVDMVGGHGSGLLEGGPYPIGDVICFEVGYDDMVRSSVAAGAQLLVVQTNNATFGHSPETYQQLAMSQLRAVELGRTVVQVSTTGVSAVIGPDGRIRARSGPLFTADRIVRTVPLRASDTLAERLGAIPEYVLCAVALATLAFGMATRSRARGTRAGAPGAEEGSSL